MKKHAQEKFKTICKPPGEEKNYKEMSKIQKIKKNKKDPLDVDKKFLLGLMKEFEEQEVVLPDKEKYGRGQDTSGHVKEILEFLHSREQFWDQI